MIAGSENLTSTAPAAAAPPAAELEREHGDLLALARQVDGTISAPIPGSPEALELERQAAAAPAKIPLEQELAGMFAMIGAGAGHWLPSVKRVLDDAACKSLGDALAPVAHKYGLARYLEGFAWRVELQALMVAVPIGLALRDGVRADIAELKRRQARAEGRAPELDQAELDRQEIAERAEIEGMVDQVMRKAPAAPLGMLQPTGGYIPT